MSHQYKTDDVIQLQVLCLLQKLLYLLPGKWHDDFNLDSWHRWRLGPDSLITPSLSIYYLSVGGEAGAGAGKQKEDGNPSVVFFPFLHLSFSLSFPCPKADTCFFTLLHDGGTTPSKPQSSSFSWPLLLCICCLTGDLHCLRTSS